MLKKEESKVLAKSAKLKIRSLDTLQGAYNINKELHHILNYQKLHMTHAGIYIKRLTKE